MKEILLVMLAMGLAHLIVWCRDPLAGWRQKIEDECRQGVEEFERVYGAKPAGSVAVVSTVWMADEE